MDSWDWPWDLMVKVVECHMANYLVQILDPVPGVHVCVYAQNLDRMERWMGRDCGMTTPHCGVLSLSSPLPVSGTHAVLH